MTTYANRGKKLERAIRELFKSYESRGIFCQQNHPEQLHDGTLVKRHGFDFEMLYQGTFYAFDAKECALTRWPIDKAKLHQLNSLRMVQNQGGVSFFLVHFTTLHKLVKFDAGYVQSCLEHGEKSLSPQGGKETTINLLGVK